MRYNRWLGNGKIVDPMCRAFPLGQFADIIDKLTADDGYEAPVGEVEQAVAAIWQELLPVQRVSRWDNFFDLGGHSLTGTRMFARVRREFAVALPLSTVFETPILQSLSWRIAQHVSDEFSEGMQAL